MSLRQAALTAGFAYLLSPVTTAEFSIMPKLVIPGSIVHLRRVDVSPAGK
jgi:hypothetical protein